VKLYQLKIVATLLVVAALTFGESQSKETRISIGVLNLVVNSPDPNLVSKGSDLVKSYLTALGMYTVATQVDMEKSFASIGKRFPAIARDPRVVIEIGTSCRLDRMIYGSLDQNRSGYGVVLTLIDVLRRQTIGEVRLEGAAGTDVGDLIKVAVDKLHGKVDDSAAARISVYYGPEAHNETEGVVTSGVAAVLGLVWSGANGSLYGRDNNSAVLDVDYGSRGSDLGNLSGVPTSADHIPIFGRPAALANAYVAASEDAYGVLYNPAGSAWTQSRSAAFGYQYRYGLNLFAASYVNKATREIGYGQAFLYCSDSANLLNEAYFITGLSYKFNHLVSFLRPFSLGIDLKIASIATGKTQTASASTGNAFGLWTDIGLKWELSPQIEYGLVVRDLSLVSSWHNTATNASYYEAQPPQLLMGGTFRAGYSTLLIAEGQVPLYGDQTWQMAGGIEQEMFRVIRARIGVRKEILSTLSTPWIVTGGLGLNVPTEQWFGREIVVDASYGFNQFGPFSNVLNFSGLVNF
jgi:hypothetical protein